MKTYDYAASPPAAVDVKNTRMLEPGATETRGHAETNVIQRQVTKNKTPKDGGVRRK